MGVYTLIRIIILLGLSTIILTSCNTSGIEKEQTEETEITQTEISSDQITSSEETEEVEEPTENTEDVQATEDNTVEEIAQEVNSYVIPSFNNPVDVAEAEGLILSNSGVYVYQDPDKNSTRLGMLGFGEHVFTILEIDEWAYIAAHNVQGWVLTTDVSKIPYDTSKKIEVTNPNDILTIVNKTYRLPRDYAPTDLTIPNIAFPFDGTDDRKRMRKEAADKLEELFTAATQDGIELFGISGYRSYATQSQIFPSNVVRRNSFEAANKTSAFPGESEHQTGLAMDVSSRSAGFTLEESFGNTNEGIWVKDNAHKYGFIIRYPKGKENITGYTYEPWHLRYVGVQAATEIYSLNTTLEEYLGKN